MSEPELTEEQLKALEAELERITVDDVVMQTVVSLINLGARKAGLGAPPGEAPTPDWEQTRQAIDAVRALLPLMEERHGDKLKPVRDALSQLQIHYARSAGPAAKTETGAEKPAGGDDAQRSSRLWVPGQ